MASCIQRRSRAGSVWDDDADADADANADAVGCDDTWFDDVAVGTGIVNGSASHSRPRTCAW